MRIRFLVILDFEATCCSPVDPTFPHEIIEFPLLVIDLDSKSAVAEFHEFVKPVVKPDLTPFCRDLTGITPEKLVDCDTFPKVFQRAQQFLTRHQLESSNSCLVTCGDWDLAKMMPKQLALSKLLLLENSYFRQWINIKRVFQSHYSINPQDLLGMLSHLHIPLIGRHHSGLDDSRNIGSIALRMVKDGWIPSFTASVNDLIPSTKMKTPKVPRQPKAPPPPKLTVWDHTRTLTQTINVPFIDIGVNLSHAPLCKQIPEVLSRAKECKVSTIILTGTSLEGSQHAIDTARQYSTSECRLYCTVGIHPHDAEKDSMNNPDYIAKLETMITDNKLYVVAVGECGLDFDRNFSSPEHQKMVFTEQVKLAGRVGLPLFLHERSAHNELVTILQNNKAERTRALLHCFTSESESELETLLLMDMYFGITGWIADDREGRGGGLAKLCHRIPLDRLCIETDAPFLLPRNMPKPWPKSNEPGFVSWVAKKVADCHGVSLVEVANSSSTVARSFFNLKI